jgi:hypothetical protein
MRQLLLLASLAFVACRNPNGTPGSASGSAQAPPTTSAGAVDSWLAEGAYLTVRGHAVYRHVRAGATGDTWFWYETIGGSVGAFGLGDVGAPRDSCAACHGRAGSAAGYPGHDFVYTQVR